jgi:PAS domain S-box-containing protein
MVAESLRILILEDNRADAELVQFEIQEAGIIFTSKVVATENEYVQSIHDYCPDLILSDYDLPKYNGALALAEARRRCPDTPFILVTGAVTEDRAIEILTQGAKDYVLKSRLQQRLAPAIKRSLAEAGEHKARKQAEAELREAYRTLEERVKIRTAELEVEIETREKIEQTLREAHSRTAAILESIADAFYSLDDQWRFVAVNPAAERAPLGQPASELLGKVIWDIFPTIVGTRIHQHYLDAVEKRSREHYEAQSPLNGRWYEVFMFPRERGLDVYLRDITERKQAEETVSLSQKTFYELVERSPFGTYVVDSQFRIAQMNAASQTGAFRNVRPVIGRDFTEAMRILWPEPVAAEIIAAFRQTLDTGEPYYSPRFTNPRHDVTIVESYEWELHRMKLPDGQYGVICYYFDSTKLRDAQEALRKSVEQYRNLVRYAPAGIYDVDFATGRFKEVNDAMCQILGYTRDELLAMTPFDILDDEGRALFASRIRGAQFGEQLNEAIEYQVRTKEGRLIWALLNTTFHWDGARIIGATVVAHDITERRKAGEALRESEEKYTNLVKYAPAAIYEMDLQGTKFFSVNEAMCNILRYSREELLSMKPADLLDEGSGTLFKERMRKKLAGEKIDETFEYRVRRKDGEWIQIAVNVGGFAYTDKKPTRVAVIAYDITERKKAEMSLEEKTRQLQDANREMESFSYSVSHDLRAPLRAIDGYSRMILRIHKDKLDEDALGKFNVIMDSTQMMGQLIDDLLALSHLGKTQLSVARLDMGVMIREVWEEIRAANPGRNLKLTIGAIPPAAGDRGLIRQILVNLLSNAVKFTRHRPEALIKVDGQLKDAECIYTVGDNGVGFDMQYHDKMFGVFQRLHSHQDFEGTGVGLSIVERIVHRHGGRIWAEGEVDKGATFYFTLPTSQE